MMGGGSSVWRGCASVMEKKKSHNIINVGSKFDFLDVIY